jgi:penicillin-binding protein 1A
MASMARNGRRKALWWERTKVFFGVVFLLVLLGVNAGIIYGVYLFRETQKSLPKFDSLIEYRPGGITEVFATDTDPKTGKLVVLGKVYGQYKQFAKIQDIPDVVKKATVAIEDERFYTHRGVDFYAVGRAVYKNYRSKRMSEGASTLTQQLAKNLFLNNKKTISRKLQEMLLAIQIETNFSKDQILELYLNEVCYGRNTYGIRAAAKVYFNKPLNKLTLAEASLLAGIPQRPTDYELFDPKHREKAIKRREDVLAKMQELGYVKAEDVKKAKAEKLKIAPEPDPLNTNFKAPYFTNYVLKQLVTKYGKDRVYNGGLKVYTTLNYKMQQEAERALINGVMKGRGSGVTEGAIVSIEPRTGYVRAMVGGKDFDKNKYNNVTQGRRQPGSSFKVFVYTAAFMSGKFGPDSVVSDSPVSYGGWSPKNYGGNYHGSVTLRTALTFSYNIPAVKVADAVGIDKVLTTAKGMGIDTTRMERQRNLALALGAGEVTPLEIASAYSVYPNRGNHAKPMSIIRVVDSEGVLVDEFPPQVDRGVVPESVVASVSDILGAVVSRGTAASAAGIQEVQGARGKTGTTNDNRDAWFVGYTPELSTAVWVCGVQRTTKGKKVIVTYPPMQGVTGGQVCAPIWARFMKAAVPIQRQWEQANRQLPEQVIPSNSIIAERTGIKETNKPKATPTPSATPTVTDEMEVPRATPTPAARPERTETDENTEDGTTNDTPSVPNTNATARDIPQGDSAAPPETRGNAYTAVPNGGGRTVNEASGGVNADTNGIRTVRSVRTGTNRQTINEGPRNSRLTAGTLPEERMVTISICPDSGQRSTRWCPEQAPRTMMAGRVPRGTCRTHKPRPGDG